MIFEFLIQGGGVGVIFPEGGLLQTIALPLIICYSLVGKLSSILGNDLGSVEILRRI